MEVMTAPGGPNNQHVDPQFGAFAGTEACPRTFGNSHSGWAEELLGTLGIQGDLIPSFTLSVLPGAHGRPATCWAPCFALEPNTNKPLLSCGCHPSED